MPEATNFGAGATVFGAGESLHLGLVPPYLVPGATDLGASATVSSVIFFGACRGT